jgi:hypothetical protein
MELEKSGTLKHDMVLASFVLLIGELCISPADAHICTKLFRLNMLF